MSTNSNPPALVPAQLVPFEGQSPRVDASAWIAPGATLIGDVTIGPDSSIWYGCILRADVHWIRIGARSNVQDASVLHVTRQRFETIVGDEVTIGHRAVVHGCRIHDGALIGIGAVVLDGAEVGEGALVGAGAVVPPGSRVPPRGLVLGTPARFVRQLEDEELERQRQRTLMYVELAKSHAASAG